MRPDCFVLLAAVTMIPLPGKTGPIAPAQAADATGTQRFDVASIKPTQRGRDANGLSISSDPEIQGPGTFRVTNNSLEELIRWAYRVKRYQVIGPIWLNDDSESFDIEARMAPSTAKLQSRTMLRTLLEERFKLTLHRETRMFPVYELLPAKGGPRLEPAKPDAKAGISYEGKFWSKITSEKASAAQFVSLRSDRLDHPVIDKAGIQTPFAVSLEYRIDDNDTVHPSLFGALQERMGLRLQPAKGPVEVLMIDHIEKALSEN